MRKAVSLLAVATGLALTIVGVAFTPGGNALQATPEASAPVTVASEVLGSAEPDEVPNPDLSLSRVTFMPGAETPVHYHPGTEIGYVVQGALTYTVFEGEAEVFRAAGGENEIVLPGATVVLEVGDGVIEPAGMIHQGRNEGDTPMVIYISSLFPEGETRAIPVSATPAA